MSDDNDDGLDLLSIQLARLLRAALDTAQGHLQRHDGFPPGSIVQDRDGAYGLAAAAIGGHEGSHLLIAGLRKQAAAGEIDAAAVYQDVRVRQTGGPQDLDAIHVVLEDARGLALQAFQVYRKDAAEGYAFEQVVIQPATPSIFLDPPSTLPHQEG